MYHIPNDKRAYSSACRIYDALIAALEHMAFSEISIKELERRGISRATFYRLFDNLSDVLEWKCEMMMRKSISKTEKGFDGSISNVLLSFIASIADNKTLISTLAVNSKTYILYDMHMRHMSEIEKIFFGGMELNDVSRTSITALLSAMIPVLCDLCLRFPESSAEDILSYLKDALERLNKALAK